MTKSSTGRGKGQRRGRRTGSRNKGYFWRNGRGWYARIDGKQIALTDEAGNKLDEPQAKSAAERLRATALVAPAPIRNDTQVDCTVREAARAYLQFASKNNAPSTIADRGRTLFDFVTGFPGRWPQTSEESDRLRAHANNINRDQHRSPTGALYLPSASKFARPALQF